MAPTELQTLQDITSYENLSLTPIQSCQRQEPRSPVPAILPERLQEPHPSLEDCTTKLIA